MHYLPERWQKGNTRRTKKFHSHLLVNNEEQEKVKTTAVNCNEETSFPFYPFQNEKICTASSNFF